MSKLDLLKEYIDIQAHDDALWFISDSYSENYLQQELRRVAWLIKEASEEQIKKEIENYKGRL